MCLRFVKFSTSTSLQFVAIPYNQIINSGCFDSTPSLTTSPPPLPAHVETRRSDVNGATELVAFAVFVVVVAAHEVVARGLPADASLFLLVTINDLVAEETRRPLRLS